MSSADWPIETVGSLDIYALLSCNKYELNLCKNQNQNKSRLSATQQNREKYFYSRTCAGNSMFTILTVRSFISRLLHIMRLTSNKSAFIIAYYSGSSSGAFLRCFYGQQLNAIIPTQIRKIRSQGSGLLYALACVFEVSGNTEKVSDVLFRRTHFHWTFRI